MCYCRRPPPRPVAGPLELRDLLVAAKDAHTKWEQDNGTDADWPLWYAMYIWQRLPEAKTDPDGGLKPCL